MAELTRKQKFTQGLLVAGIAAVGALVASTSQALISSTLEAPKLRAELAPLREELTKKSAELQRLQTEMVPFKTLALQYFTGTEAERISKLAMKLQDLQSGYLALAEKENTTSEKTVELAKKIAPRTISLAQKDAFRRSVFHMIKGKVSVLIYLGDNEATFFADSVISMLKECGFTVTDIGQGVFHGVVPPIAFTISDNKNLPPHSDLALAFQSIGLTGPRTIDPRLPLDEVRITIGPKPTY